MSKKLKITLIKSPHGRIPKHKAVLNALGLKKTNKTIIVPDNDRMLGMIKKIEYLVSVERVECLDA